MLPSLLPLPAQGHSPTRLLWLLLAPSSTRQWHEGQRDTGKASPTPCWYKKKAKKGDFSPQLLTCDPLHTTPAHQGDFQGASLVQ